MKRFRIAVAVCTVLITCLPHVAWLAYGDDDVKPDTPNPPAADGPAATDAPAASPEGEAGQAPLSMKQDAVAMRYKRFEKTLRQMAEYLRGTDPDRANLLYRAINQSSENRISQQLDEIVAILADEHPKFGEALDRQQDTKMYLQALLKLLQSEDRKAEVEKERKRIEALLQDLKEVIGEEKKVRNETDRRQANPEKIARDQEKVKDKTRDIGEKIDRQDAERNGESAKGQNGKKQSGDGKQSGGDPKEGENNDGKSDDEKKDGENSDEKNPKPDQSDEKKPGEGKEGEKPGEKNSDEKKPGDDKSTEKDSAENKPGEGSEDGEKKGGEKSSKGKPSQGKPQKGKPGEQGEQSEGESGKSQPGEQEDQPDEMKPLDKTPGREEIEKAKQQMEEAIEKLKSRKLEDASGNQDEAIKQLIKAKERLEEILRQLREEERELLLAALEARFQKMLAMQLLVNKSTVDLSKVAKEEWTSIQLGRTRELSGQEDEIAVEAAKALNLLKEEGSSVAFPEAVMQLRQDMLTVARRLERSDVGELTQGIENDIVESLEELVEALRKEMEKLKEDQQQQKQQQQQQGDKSLVDAIAELKMLRSLQHRINRRTRQLGELTKGEQAVDADAVTQLRQLSQRQARVQEATYDLSTGKNR